MKRDKFRKEVQKRTIDPSADSWNKLEQQLNAHENKHKARRWQLLKIASIALLLVSVGVYFFDPAQDRVNSPVITEPAVENAIKKPIEDNSLSESEASTVTDDTSNTIDLATDAKMVPGNRSDINQGQRIALTDPVNQEKITTINTDEISDNKMVPDEIAESEVDSTEDQLIDREIEQLLRSSKVKLIVNGQISSKKLVNSDALLNAVEDDLDKDLKQKILEKITNTIKKDKELVSSKEN